MAEPITLPVETDPAELAAIAYDHMESAIAGWDRARGDQDSQVIAATAQIIAEARDTASDVPLAIFRYLGRWVDELPPIDATPAQTTATVTALDTAGYTIDDATRFEIRTSGDSGEVFQSVGTVTIAPGASSTAAGEVVLVAETPGAAGSGLPAASKVVPVDALAWVNTVTLTALTTGGIDAETDEEYLARWVLLRRLNNDTPILAADAADLVKALIPGIGRTLGLDNYNPADATSNNEKMITVATADPNGEPVAQALRDEAKALLESKRETNFVTHVISGSYTTINVSTAFTVYPGYDVAATNAAVVEALTAYLHPAASGIPFGGTADEWVPDTHVRYLELAAVIDRVEGVNVITSLTLSSGANALGTADVVLAQPAPLTRPGTITATGTA